MPKTPKEIERIILKDGWILQKSNAGSHRKYYHPFKKGKVTIPYHKKDLNQNTLKSICEQAQIDWRKYK